MGLRSYGIIICVRFKVVHGNLDFFFIFEQKMVAGLSLDFALAISII